MLIYIDGKFLARDAAKVSVFDHGLLYGDGVFEGIRIYSRRIFRLDAHLDRLYASAKALALGIPLAKAEMAEVVRETVRRNRKVDGYIRLIVTRGEGDLGIDPTTCPRPTVIVIVTEIRLYPAEQYETGVKVLTSPTRQVSHEAIDPRVKSLNYLKNVLAKIDAQRAGVHEAIMLNAEGFIAECTADNLFLVRRGALLTPAPQDGALEGITRGAILELAAAEGLPTREARLTRFDLYTADEAFMTGTGAEVVPIAEADGRPIGTGSRPVTLRLRKGFQELARTEGEPVF
jgi:branched-chain amino acid aminotransferase